MVLEFRNLLMIFLPILIITILILSLIPIISSWTKSKYKIEEWEHKWTISIKLGMMRIHSSEVIPLGIMTLLRKRIRLSYVQMNGGFIIRRKFMFCSWKDMQVVRYGDLDDDYITVSYNNEEDAKRYCRNVVKSNAVADRSKQILEVTNHGDLF